MILGFSAFPIDKDFIFQNFAPQLKQVSEIKKDIKKNPSLELARNSFSPISSFYENLDYGIYTYHTRGQILNEKGFATLEKLEKNSSIYASLTNFKVSVVAPRFIVKQADDSDKSKYLKDFIDCVLSEMNGTLEDSILGVLSAIIPGYSISEKVFKNIEFDNKIKIGLESIKSKKAGLYGFLLDQFDNILAIHSLIDFIALPVEKFIVFNWLKLNNNPYGFPLFDVLYPLYYSINELQKMMLIGASRFANPSTVVTVPDGASDIDVSYAKDFIKNISQSSAGILPESVKAMLLEISNRSQQPFIEMLHYLISEVEKVILLNDLTVSQSKGGGTRAETQAKISEGKEPLILYTRRILEDVIFEQLIKQLIEINFDKSEFPINFYPKICFNDEIKEDREQFVNIIEKLTNLGYINASDEIDRNWVRQVIEAPTLNENEDEQESEDIENFELFNYDLKTNFPNKNDDKQIILKNSNYPVFDYDFALMIKEKYPKIWSKGGNIRGNEAFDYWTKAREGKDSESIQDWIKERESWIARHFKDYLVAGVVAQIKWGAIGSRGIDYMKNLINKEIEKLEE